MVYEHVPSYSMLMNNAFRQGDARSDAAFLAFQTQLVILYIQ